MFLFSDYVSPTLGIFPVIRVIEDEINSLQFSQETLRGYRQRNLGKSKHPSLGSAEIPGGCGVRQRRNSTQRFLNVLPLPLILWGLVTPSALAFLPRLLLTLFLRPQSSSGNTTS